MAKRRKIVPRRNRRPRSLSQKASSFIAKHVKRHIKDFGMSPKQAVAAAYEEARGKGYRVPRRGARSNPRGGVVIGDAATSLTYEGGKGKRKGKMRGPWKHMFESDDVEIIGDKSGDVRLRSKSGARLWDFFEV